MLYKVYLKLRSFKKWYQKIFRFTDKRQRTDFPVSFGKKLKWNVRGFTDEEITIFQLDDENWKRYISRQERNRLETVNPSFWADLLGKKVLFEKVFGPIIRVPHIYWWSYGGRFLSPEDGSAVDAASLLMETDVRLVLKPSSSGGGGEGVFFVDGKDGVIRVDGSVCEEPGELLQKLQSLEDYIAVERVEQAAYSDNIFPGSVNSIRIVTVYDGTEQKPEPLFAYHRFGTEFSRPVDNVRYGGVFALIDLDTGRMSKAKCKYFVGKEYTVHPDTGATIENVVVPDWKDLLQTVVGWHEHLPQYCFLAWDVVIDREGNPYVLEINRGSGLTIQMISPMRNDNLGKWMDSRKLLDRR